MAGLVTQQHERSAWPGTILIRIMDVVFSVVMLILTAPVMLAAAVAIKIESPGPVLFTQKRVGQHNRLFTLYKLRTMRVGTPEVAKESLTNLGEFVTVVGSFLRKTSIDELPQLINVIMGDMSLVGPRPALYNQYDLIAMRTDLGIHRIRPGITGIAQVRGREDLSLEEKVAFDRQLAESLGPGLYIRLLIDTLVAVVTARGAY
ncbi:MAG: sugar transferase [Bacillota bacterium]